MNLITNWWQLWLLVAVVAGILEVALPYFTFAFVSTAAVAALLSSFYAGWPVQAVFFTIALLLSLLFVRPKLINKLHRNHWMPSRSEELVGAKGEVTDAIDPIAGTGRVLVQGQDWAARSEGRIELGRPIEVRGHDGIVLIVKEI